MRCRDLDVDRYRDRDAIPCNWHRIRRDRSTRVNGCKYRLSFVLPLDESANLASVIDSRSAWIDERVRDLSVISQKFVIANAADTRGLSRVQNLGIRVAKQIA